MSIKAKFIIIFASLFAAVLFFSYFTIIGLGEIDKHVTIHVPEAIKNIQNLSKLDITAQLVRYDDEVLTQSARNYVFTGDKKWKDRYSEYVPKLDQRIKEANELGDDEDKKIFSDINATNLVLIDLETEAISLADNGDLSQAQAILDGSKYVEQKAIYKAGIDKILLKRGHAIDEADSVSTEELESDNKEFTGIVSWQKYGTMGFVALFFLAIMFIIWQILITFMIPLGVFRATAKKIITGDLSASVAISSENEIGDFAIDFNTMTKSLQESIENTENKVKERTADLEKLNKFMTGRELKMIELKKKIAEMEKITKKNK